MATYVRYTPVVGSLDSCDLRLLDYVSQVRRDRVLRVRQPHDAKLSLYAGLLARSLLSEVLGVPHGELRFERLPQGKPTVSGYPGVDVSLSHTEGLVLCGVSTDGRLGVDVERVLPPRLNAVRRVFTPLEAAYVLSGVDTAERFFRVWTQKEAYSKYLGCGLCGEVYRTDTLAPSLAYHTRSQPVGEYVCSTFLEHPSEYVVRCVPSERLREYYLGA